MTMETVGIMDWSGTRDVEGHRHYKVKYLCKSNSTLDGPYEAMQAAGLPSDGSYWNPGNDYDQWAFCTPARSASPLYKRERSFYWVVESNFTTKPLKRCQDETIENPMDEPPTLSGSFVNYTKEVNEDKDGNKILSSSHEILRGDLVTFDHNRAQVSIGLNVLSLPLGSFASMMDTVNDSALWGLGKRKIKLSNVSWSRVLYGVCYFYYEITYEFDIRFDTFDTKPIDEGTKIRIKGGNANNPNDFKLYKDVNEENTRVLLDGAGNALTSSTPVEIDVKYYQESNFLSLGIPPTL